MNKYKCTDGNLTAKEIYAEFAEDAAKLWVKIARVSLGGGPPWVHVLVEDELGKVEP